jgi:hypothetical protein
MSKKIVRIIEDLDAKLIVVDENGDTKELTKEDDDKSNGTN